MPLLTTILEIPKMDCPAEERLLRDVFAGDPDVVRLAFDLPKRRLRVTHSGTPERIVEKASSAGLGATRLDTQPADPADAGEEDGVDTGREARVLRRALAINALMFVVELAAGLIARSVGLIADSLDMFADASVYGLSLYAVGRSIRMKRRAAHLSGWVQLLLAAGAFAEVVRHFLTGGTPDPLGMVGVALLALVANTATLLLLSGHRSGAIHMQASWIFTANDVLANVGVIAAGVLVHATGTQWPDLLIGTVIAAIVAGGAWRILRLR